MTGAPETPSDIPIEKKGDIIVEIFAQINASRPDAHLDLEKIQLFCELDPRIQRTTAFRFFYQQVEKLKTDGERRGVKGFNAYRTQRRSKPKELIDELIRLDSEETAEGESLSDWQKVGIYKKVIFAIFILSLKKELGLKNSEISTSNVSGKIKTLVDLILVDKPTS